MTWVWILEILIRTIIWIRMSGLKNCRWQIINKKNSLILFGKPLSLSEIPCDLFTFQWLEYGSEIARELLNLHYGISILIFALHLWDFNSLVTGAVDCMTPIRYGYRRSYSHHISSPLWNSRISSPRNCFIIWLLLLECITIRKNASIHFFYE